MTIEILPVIRDGDDYEQKNLDISEVVMGYYALGHRNKEEFLANVLSNYPDTLIDWTRYGWWGRWKRGKIIYEFTPHKPEAHEVVHTSWRTRGEYLKRARPGSRGAFDVTYLPIEACPWIGSLSDIYDEDTKTWWNYFYPHQRRK